LSLLSTVFSGSSLTETIAKYGQLHLLCRRFSDFFSTAETEW
jgi:hypothetical protein